MLFFVTDTVKGKGKVHPITGHEDPESSRLQLYSIFNLGVRWDGWTTPCPSRFTSEKDAVPFVWVDVWAPAPVRKFAESIVFTGV